MHRSLLMLFAIHSLEGAKSVKNLSSFSHKATITRCDLSSRFFCIDATLLCEFESDKI